MYGLCEHWNQTHAYRRFLHCKNYKENFDPKKITSWKKSKHQCTQIEMKELESECFLFFLTLY